jgi:hypothetical protein
MGPGLALMQRVRMPVKLSTMAFLLGAPLLLMTYLELSTLRSEYLTASNEALGSQAVSLVTEVLTDVQQLRAGPAEAAPTSASLQQLQADEALLSSWLEQHPEQAWGRQWQATLALLQPLQSPVSDARASQLAYAAASKSLRQLGAASANSRLWCLMPIRPPISCRTC